MSARLRGMGVVITRPRPEGEALAAELEALGARTFVFPALSVEPVAASAPLAAALAALPRAHLAIFVSANAVAHGLAQVRSRGAWPAGVRVAGIGDATARALRNSGFAEVISPGEPHDSEALLALPQLHDVRGENIIVFRGEGGRERLKEVLESRGATVVYAECYRRSCPATDPAPLLAAWSRGEVQAVSVLSGETLGHFVALLGEAGRERLAQATLVVPHAAIAARPEARRFGRTLVAGHGAAAIAEALSDPGVSP